MNKINMFKNLEVVSSKEENKAKKAAFLQLITKQEEIFSKEFISKEENRNRYVSNGYKMRAIWTPLGWLEIKRKEFKDVITGDTIKPFDDELGLMKGIKVPEQFYDFIKKTVEKTKSYKEAGEKFFAPLSSTTICTIMKKVNERKLKKVKI